MTSRIVLGLLGFLVVSYSNAQQPYRPLGKPCPNPTPAPQGRILCGGAIDWKSSPTLTVTITPASPPPDGACVDVFNAKLPYCGQTLADCRQLLNPPTGRIAVPRSPYSRLHANWVQTLHPAATLPSVAAEIQKRYWTTVESRIPEPRIEFMQPDYATLVYKQGYDGVDKGRDVRVALQRMRISVTDATGDTRLLVAYILIPEEAKNVATTGPLVLALNGHIQCASLAMIGLVGDGTFGLLVGRLAVRGYTVITFEDRKPADAGTESDAVSSPLGLITELADLRAIDTALLTAIDPRRPWQDYRVVDQRVGLNNIDHKWSRIDAVGLSGGSERLFHYLMISRSQVIKSAYLAGVPQSPWMSIDNVDCDDTGFGFDSDTFDYAFLSSFQWSDLLLPALTRKVRLRLAVNTREDGNKKYVTIDEIAAAVRRYGPITVGGDDPTGSRKWTSGTTSLCHEYDFQDYLKFLSDSRANPLKP